MALNAVVSDFRTERQGHESNDYCVTVGYHTVCYGNIAPRDINITRPPFQPSYQKPRDTYRAPCGALPHRNNLSETRRTRKNKMTVQEAFCTNNEVKCMVAFSCPFKTFVGRTHKARNSLIAQTPYNKTRS